ncbi:MAG TPA: DUF1559 domain-containing protein [Phycisphaerae bacterium]|nr:DUF1559 domain-containing protein [Phycisphaerae bacterium]
MQGRHDDFERHADLIGYQLGLCDAAEMARVEEALQEDPRMIQARARLAGLLSMLEADEPVEAPADLNESILARIDGLHRTMPMRPALAAGESGGPARPMFNLRELLSLAAVIAIFVGVFVPGYRTARENARIAQCGLNMANIGRGVTMYREAYGSPVPMVASLPDGESWVPSNATGVSNSQNPFELVRRQLVAPSAFNDPGREGDLRLDKVDLINMHNFPDVRNNSYSTSIVTARRQPFEPESPVAADLTPLVNQMRQLNPDGKIPLNSTSHRGKGQNVGKMDMRVIFTRTPNAGLDSDDIYRVIGVQKYTGLERPSLRSDAFLVP